MGEYRTIEGESVFELVEKKSRFIAHLIHVNSEDEALEILATIRKAHAQARHNVYAYILNGGRARYSDDGEPAQTSGLPTYDTLMHANLLDVICVTTRYFGGTLLGTGGLVRAYTQACQGAIAQANIVTVQMCADVRIEITYDLYQTVQKICEANKSKFITTDFTDKVLMLARIKAEDAESLSADIVNATSGRCQILISEPFEGVL